MQIDIGKTKAGKTISLPLARANRHGLVTGSTGGGKTVTLQRLAEEFSRAGVPVFAADVKGDLSGISALGNPESALAARAVAMSGQFAPDRFPVQFWDIFGVHGVRIRTSVQSIGPELMARMLKLNPTQEGALAICFRKAEDEKDWMLTLDDLRWSLNDMLDDREAICKNYGNITASSISSIQRQLLSLESQCGAHLFGEPPFEISDFLRIAGDGRGVVNLLHADNLMECPKLYAVFLLWLLTELFRALPEAGDVEKPKLVFFFDEAHLLFSDAPKELVQQIERLVRLVRSKGVGVFFVTQSPADIPDTVLSQLGSRIQHALRAYTPKDQRMVKAAAQAFRENREVDVKREITALGVGEALISVLDEAGVPTKVEKVEILPPAAQVGPISEMERASLLSGTPLMAKYAEPESEERSIWQFRDRMREARGLHRPPYVEQEPWAPGGYAAFVPGFPPEEPPRPGRMFHLKRLLFWSAWFAGSVMLLRYAAS